MTRSPLFRMAAIFSISAVSVLSLGGSVLDVLLSTFFVVIALDFARPFGDYSVRHALVVAVLLGKAGWFFAFAPASATLSAGGSRDELLSRRDYLTQRIIHENFGPSTSPGFFPTVMQEEWAIGTLSMFGAALANLSYEFPETREEHLRLVDTLVRRMLESDIRIYEKRHWEEDALDTLDGPKGHIGYLGHLDLLLAVRRLLGGDGAYADLESRISSALSRRILSSPTRYLETYPGQIFIPDNAVVIASLALFNLIERSSGRAELYRPAVEAWRDYTKAKLIDPETGIIIPWLDTNGEPFGHPRGSYSTWNVFYLMQADRDFAEDQSKRIRERFLTRFFPGLCGAKEYLPEHRGAADISSGPVIFSLSTAGTGFAMASARALDDREMLRCLLNTGELVGGSVSGSNGRSYFTAPLIGDAIVLAMRTAIPWDDRYLRAATSK